ncbi:MAG TPA: family 20 glycosylhydrolase [Acidobacteriaceae bacterium]|nr:family 20 glycosylhydrolase [Acidobacteriaceae bacterium]
MQAQRTANASTTDLGLMPLPSHLEAGTGSFTLRPGTHVAYTHFHNARLEAGVIRVMERLQFESGVPLPHVPSTVAGDVSSAGIVIDVAGAGGAVQSEDEDESYSLTVTPQLVTLKAATVVGAFHGMETLLQLVQLKENAATIPVVSIEDTPRFQWRGLMIDVSRHFEPVNQIERTLDGMAMVKLNVFHWHLSDDQGFRAESKLYPKLTGLGSNGEFYTQEQMREVVAYARARGIRVVPEFDIPGHTVSWMVAYPQLGSSKGPFHLPDVAGIHDEALDPTREGTYVFLNRVIGEMTKIFPDAYFHIGGDEVNGQVWTSNPRIARFMKRKGFEKPSQLQTYFSQRVVRIVEKHGKKPIGWDEVLVPGLPKNVLVQSWRGVDSLAAGAQQGYRGILSAPYYLDGMKSNETHYLADPIPADTTLTAEQQKLILGGEVCMWAEQLNERTIDSRIWPRTAVMAERFWSPQSDRDVVSMYQRLPRISIELELAGLKHMTGPAMMRRSISGEVNPTALTVLAGVLEPVSFGERYEGQHTDGHTPLDRLVDTVVPDPPSRFEIAQDVDAVLNKTADSTAAEARLTRRFMEWQEIAPSLATTMQANPRMSDAAIRAQQLGELGRVGLQALLNLDPNNSAYGGPKLAASDPQSQLAAIADAEKPAALVRFTFLDSLKRLVQAEK